MIRITVEVVPFGMEELSKTVATGIISNDLTGNAKYGNYKAEFYDHTDTKIDDVRVVGHNRDDCVWKLVQTCLTNAKNIKNI